MTYPAPVAKKPKGALITGIVLVVLSVVVFIAGIVWGGVKVATTVSDSPVFATPGQVTTTLDAGEHALWTPTTGLTLPPAAVTVTGPSGEVTTSRYSSSTSVTVTKGSDSYSPELTFNAPTTGSYTVVVDDIGGTTDVLVGPPPGIVGDTFIVIAAAFGVASLIGLVGVVLFIIGLVARSRAKKAAQPPVGPGGYGPGPGGYAPQPGYGQQPTYGQPPAGPQPGYGQPPAGPPPGPPGS